MEEKKIINDLENISKSTKIADEDGNGFYRIFWDDKVEKVNPVEYYKNEYPHVPKLAKFKLPRCPNGMFWNTLCFM